MVATHFPHVHHYSFLHVTTDTSSVLIWASAHCSEKASTCFSHVLFGMATMGKPFHLKANNAPAFISSYFAQFCNQWNIILTHGISHNPTGQALVECAHCTLKMCLLKQKQRKGPRLTHVNNPLNIAFFKINAPIVQYKDNTHYWSSALGRRFTPKEPLPKIYVKH